MIKLIQSELSDALKILKKVIDKKGELNILKTFRFKAKDGNLSITASNLNESVKFIVPCDGEIDVCLNADTVTRVCKPIKKNQFDTVEMEATTNESVFIYHGGMKTELLTQDAKDFLEVECIGEVFDTSDFSSKYMFDALSHVLPAVSDDTTRSHINCVAIDGGKMLSTDGHRMHISELPIDFGNAYSLSETASKVLKDICKNGGMLFVTIHENHICFVIGNFLINTRILEVEFPDYKQVYPSEHKLYLEVENKIFQNALKRLLKVHETIKLDFQLNKIEMSTDNKMEKAHLTIKSMNTGGELVTQGFRAEYLIDAISSDGVAIIRTGEKFDPLVINEDKNTAVIMPLRIDDGE